MWLKTGLILAAISATWYYSPGFGLTLAIVITPIWLGFTMRRRTKPVVSVESNPYAPPRPVSRPIIAIHPVDLAAVVFVSFIAGAIAFFCVCGSAGFVGIIVTQDGRFLVPVDESTNPSAHPPSALQLWLIVAVLLGLAAATVVAWRAFVALYAKEIARIRPEAPDASCDQ